MLCVCAVKEVCDLGAGAQVVRGEGQGACAARDAQGDGPGDRRGTVARFRNVRVAAVRIARGRARRAVEEGHGLRDCGAAAFLQKENSAVYQELLSTASPEAKAAALRAELCSAPAK